MKHTAIAALLLCALASCGGGQSTQPQRAFVKMPLLDSLVNSQPDVFKNDLVVADFVNELHNSYGASQGQPFREIDSLIFEIDAMRVLGNDSVFIALKHQGTQPMPKEYYTLTYTISVAAQISKDMAKALDDKSKYYVSGVLHHAPETPPTIYGGMSKDLYLGPFGLDNLTLTSIYDNKQIFSK